MTVATLVPIVVALVLSVAAVVTLALISPPAAAILAVALLVAGVLSPWLSAWAAARAETDGAQARARFVQDAVTVLDHAAELRVAGRLDTTLDRAHTENDAVVAATDRAAAPAAFADAATPLAVGASVLGSLLVGIAAFASDPTMSPMSLGILVLLPLAAFEAAGTMPAAALTLIRARIAAGRITDLLDRADRPVRYGTLPADGPGLLRAVDLCSGWPDGRASEPIDLNLPPGARVAIVGASGSGKTSMIMTLAGLLPAASGTASLDGVAVGDVDPAELRRRVGFFAEDAHLFETSVLENLRVARGDVDEAAATAALVSVGLGEWVSGLPDGLHTTLEGGARALSGGQRRRLLLARALLSPVQVLLLDEPTEHLDADDGARLQRLLLDRTSGLVAADRTVVVVTHQLPVGTAADRVVEVRSHSRK